MQEMIEFGDENEMKKMDYDSLLIIFFKNTLKSWLIL